MNPWPADAVERRAVSTLVPYARNARTHSPTQIDQLARLITAYGWTNPILVDEASGIIAGHGRVMAAQQLGLADVPVMVARGWTDAQRRAYVLADNASAAQAGWDDDVLKLELADLQLEGFDLDLTGFRDDQLAFLMDTTEGLTDPDEVPDAPAEPVTVLGDVWIMGRHRLMCGDSTRDVDVSLALAGVKPHLMVTDPPYGVEYAADWRAEVNRDGPNSNRAVGKVQNDDRADWSAAWTLFPGGVAYVWHGERQLISMGEQLGASDFEPRNLIVWAKSQIVFGRGHYHSKHETCWYAVKKGATGHWSGDRTQSTLWQIDKPQKSETGHSTQKPVECMKRPIENNSSAGQAVYDPFVGSGTTIIAAEMTGRACHAIELSPTYCDVAVIRWQNFTGQTATNERTGQNFADA
jgi:DNA modification methylase